MSPTSNLLDSWTLEFDFSLMSKDVLRICDAAVPHGAKGRLASEISPHYRPHLTLTGPVSSLPGMHGAQGGGCAGLLCITDSTSIHQGNLLITMLS